MASLVSFSGFDNLGHSAQKGDRRCGTFSTSEQWNGWCATWPLPTGL